MGDHASHGIGGVRATGELIASECFLDLLPARLLFRREDAHEFLKLEQVGFSAGRERLGLAPVMIEDETLNFALVHDRHHLLGQAVHVPIRALQPKWRLGPILVGLPRRMDVLEVHPQHAIADRHEFRHHGLNLLRFLRRIAAFELGSIPVTGFGQPDERAHVILALVGERRQDRVGSDGVLEVARLESVGIASDDVTQVVRVRPVRQHVRQLESLTALRIRVAGHDHHHLAPSQIVGPRPPTPHSLDLPLRVAERDELLEKLRAAMLNVIHAQHHVVTHLERQIQLLNLFARRRVRRFLGIE